MWEFETAGLGPEHPEAPTGDITEKLKDAVNAKLGEKARKPGKWPPFVLLLGRKLYKASGNTNLCMKASVLVMTKPIRTGYTKIRICSRIGQTLFNSSGVAKNFGSEHRAVLSIFKMHTLESMEMEFSKQKYHTKVVERYSGGYEILTLRAAEQDCRRMFQALNELWKRYLTSRLWSALSFLAAFVTKVAWTAKANTRSLFYSSVTTSAIPNILVVPSRSVCQTLLPRMDERMFGRLG